MKLLFEPLKKKKLKTNYPLYFKVIAFYIYLGGDGDDSLHLSGSNEKRIIQNDWEFAETAGFFSTLGKNGNVFSIVT